MKIGLVGYQGSGKSTLFHWLTGVEPDPSQAHSGQSAMTPIPDKRFEPLCKIYNPKKVTVASIEIVDTPGLSRKHEGNAAKLAMLREAGCLIFVVSAFGETDPKNDLAAFDEDLLLADMTILTGRIERLEESLKKPIPRAEHQLLEIEYNVLKVVLESMEAGKPLRESEMNDEQKKVTRAFRLFSEKPRLVVVNAADDETDPDRFKALATAATPVAVVPAGLELELAKMSPEDREAFKSEMGITSVDRDELIRQIMTVSGQATFFTAGDKEVRTWLIRQGGTALEAADGIHSDLARGFIRAEIMTVGDLVRLGSEREVKAQKLFRQEPKDYVVKDDDILVIRFSV